MSNIFHNGVVAPFDKNNVDTDQIIPKQFLTSVSRDGFGEALFFDYRYLENGEPDPAFELNKPTYKGASVLLARENFGCGSSREHAPWALKQYGFRVIIAPSFADIFYNNCVNNQMLPIILSAKDVDRLFVHTSDGNTHHVSIDLVEQNITIDEKDTVGFDIDADIKQRLLSGLDLIGITEKYLTQIQNHEKQAKLVSPWL